MAIGLDSRIGNKFLNSSVGFGGSCFKKESYYLNVFIKNAFFCLGFTKFDLFKWKSRIDRGCRLLEISFRNEWTSKKTLLTNYSSIYLSKIKKK